MGSIPKPPARPPDEVPQPMPPFGRGRAVDAGTWAEVTAEIGGRVRKGAYRVERDRVVVRGARGTRSERLGVMPAAVLAEALLCELVAEGRA